MFDKEIESQGLIAWPFNSEATQWASIVPLRALPSESVLS
jgi:hypothetical protein